MIESTPNYNKTDEGKLKYEESWFRRSEIIYSQLQVFSLAAMKAPAISSAGGIAAVLGFYSANYVELSKVEGKLDHFNLVLVWWPMALMITVVLPGMAYISQQLYVYSLNNEEYSIETNQWKGTKTSNIYEAIGNCFRVGAVLMTVLSYVFLILGGYEFWLLAT